MESVRRVALQTTSVKSEMLLVVAFYSSFFYCRRLYFKSLSSGETEKEKYFLVLQVSICFSIFLFIKRRSSSLSIFLSWGRAEVM